MTVEMVILNNKSPFVEVMKTVLVLFLVRVFQHSLLAINRLHFLILKFLILKLANYEYNNNNNNNNNNYNK